MIQGKEELDNWYNSDDPWNYENNKDDIYRKNILLSAIPERQYKNILDIGCGNGFITKELKGEKIIGIDLSSNAIAAARKNARDNLVFIQGSIFELSSLLSVEFDLIIITGVLYEQYIGKSVNLIYRIVDELLQENGILICVHIDQWYNAKFPYLLVDNFFYEYRQYTHNLEIYVK